MLFSWSPLTNAQVSIFLGRFLTNAQIISPLNSYLLQIVFHVFIIGTLTDIRNGYY
ncbi:hypothetical protein CCP3SC1_610011 [Gammaproteobacteria bacterium]